MGIAELGSRVPGATDQTEGNFIGGLAGQVNEVPRGFVRWSMGDRNYCYTE